MARILIIDDDKSFCEALAESIRDFGHDVVEASGAQETLKLINEVDATFPATAWLDSALVCARFKNGSGSPPAERLLY
jgi:CheY-like chemotaxis protein